MKLEAQVQSQFPFGGKMRQPGDVLTSEELSMTTMAVRDALVSQKLIVLTGEDGSPIDGIGGGAHTVALLERISARLDDIETRLAEGGEQFQSQIDGLRTAMRTLAGRASPEAAAAAEAALAPPAAPAAKTRPALTKRRAAAKE